VDLVAFVQSGVAEPQRLKALRAEINPLTLALVKTHSRHPKRQRGRP
jgi:hypothetical protein